MKRTIRDVILLEQNRQIVYARLGRREANLYEMLVGRELVVQAELDLVVLRVEQIYLQHAVNIHAVLFGVVYLGKNERDQALLGFNEREVLAQLRFHFEFRVIELVERR